MRGFAGGENTAVSNRPLSLLDGLFVWDCFAVALFFFSLG
jgi:hypothetical protein